MHGYILQNPFEPNFYYHPDHLGSSSYITEDNGHITQTLAYMPYGENFVDLSFGSPYETPYKYNGKEKDEETGYNYYGARYYWSDGSIWLSVDPLADKYPWISPYAYCANNPIRYIDPDGRDWYENTRTGAVYYNNKMGKNDAGKGAMTGEGWRHMGANGMFTQKNGITGSDQQLVAQNGGSIEGVIDPSTGKTTSVNMEMMLEGGGQAEGFMSGQGV